MDASATPPLSFLPSFCTGNERGVQAAAPGEVHYGNRASARVGKGVANRAEEERREGKERNEKKKRGATPINASSLPLSGTGTAEFSRRSVLQQECIWFPRRSKTWETAKTLPARICWTS